jgi:hypothetical protein
MYSYVASITLSIVFASCAINALLFGKGGALELVTGVGCVLVAVTSLIELPATIVTNSGGIEQTFWLRKNKRIRWKGVVEINTGEKIHTVTITSADGTKIIHSSQLADRARLLLELKQHCGDSLPPDFPRERIATISAANRS